MRRDGGMKDEMGGFNAVLGARGGGVRFWQGG